MSQILDYLLTRQEAMTRMLGQLVALESPSSEREAVNQVGGFLAQAFGVRG